MSKINEFIKKLSKFTSIAFVFSFLGSLGGSQNSRKAIRRYGIPSITFFLVFLKTLNLFPENLWLLTIFSMVAVLSLGYGRVTNDDSNPSCLGIFYNKLFPNRPVVQDCLIRGTVGLLMCVSLLSIPCILNNWVSYFLGCFIIMLGYTIVSWRSLGNLIMGKYELCYSDVINYGLIGTAINLMIFTNFGG
ncbi:MAG: hypothetical protein WC516_06265 [Patescibacteria group bacterium]|jgi:hypothetical protein